MSEQQNRYLHKLLLHRIRESRENKLVLKKKTVCIQLLYCNML